MSDNRPIGIFDSGIGGLSIYREVKKLLPYENIIYFADSANVPYGNKSPEQIKKLSLRILKFLESQNVKVILIACNTATVHSLDYLRSKTKLPIIGTVPVVKTAATITKTGRIGVLSTTSTAKSKYQLDLIKRFAYGVQVYNLGTDEIVPYVESGNVNSKELKNKLKGLFRSKNDIDVLALGCSHFPFVADLISQVIGKDVLIINSGAAVARQLARVLTANNVLNKGEAKDIFYTTGNTAQFKKVAEKLLGKALDDVRSQGI